MKNTRTHSVRLPAMKICVIHPRLLGILQMP